MNKGDWGFGIGPNPQSPIPKLIQIWLLFIYYQSKIINNINYYYKYTNDIY